MKDPILGYSLRSDDLFTVCDINKVAFFSNVAKNEQVFVGQKSTRRDIASMVKVDRFHFT